VKKNKNINKFQDKILKTLRGSKMADKFYKETKSHEKREEAQVIKLRNAVYEFGKELKKHEKEPMDKAHPMKK
jgi:hypothetical protein